MLASALLQEMSDRRLESDIVSYSASISASEKGSQWVQALALLREMSDQTLESDAVTYSASISASQKSLQWELSHTMAAGPPGFWLPAGGLSSQSTYSAGMPTL